jgi:hypothetical protein
MMELAQHPYPVSNPTGSDGTQWCSGPRPLRPESVHEHRYVALGELG